MESLQYRKNKLQQLTEAWKDARISGVEIFFKFNIEPEILPGFYKFEKGSFTEDDALPPEAFTGRMLDVWCVGWKCKVGENIFEDYLLLNSPDFHPEILNTLRENFENFRNAQS